MTNAKIAGLVAVSVVAVIATVGGIKAIVSTYKNRNTNTVNGGSGQTGGNNNTNPIGKTAYANANDVILLNTDFSLNSILNKDTLIGKVDSIQGASYKIGDTTVLIGDVYLK